MSSNFINGKYGMINSNDASITIYATTPALNYNVNLVGFLPNNEYYKVSFNFLAI